MFLPKMFLVFIILIQNSAQSSNKNQKPGPEITLMKRLSFPKFSPRTMNEDMITLLGSAAVSSQTGCIQIPEGNKQHSAAGRAIYSSSIRLFDPTSKSPASFETTFSFRIPGPTAGGLSFIIVPDELTVGRPGPWLGMMNDACHEDGHKVVAVEFDTRMDPEFGDPNDNHVGINLGSIVSTTVVNASSSGVRLDDGTVHRAWIAYDGNNKSLEIYLGPDDKARPNRGVYSGNLDLSPYLNEYMFIGFSGSTGDGDDDYHGHSICSWNFTSVSRALLRVPSSESCASRIHINAGGNIPRKNPSFYILVAVAFLVLVIMMINLFVNRERKEGIEYSAGKQWPPNRPQKFKLSEIYSITGRFGELQVLGSDRNSVTYKGTSLNGCKVVVVAAKRFSREFFPSGGCGSARRRMIKEIKSVSKIRHPNIVLVRGRCFDRQETVVVYDFMPNGSLDNWLHRGFGVFPWTRRFRVVSDVAKALAYLHGKGLAHKNVKASSVFIDVSFRAILGDFGFLLSPTESTRFESSVSQKVDIFEFGILILEVVSGRRRKSDPGELDLLDVAWALHENNEKSKLVDQGMPVVNPGQAVRVLEVGLMCTLNDNQGRPSMKEVVEYLNIERPLPELPASRPVSLLPYNSTTGVDQYCCLCMNGIHIIGSGGGCRSEQAEESGGGEEEPPRTRRY